VPFNGQEDVMSSDFFMNVEGIPGESTDDAHAEWIELVQFSHGVSQPVSAQSGTGGRTGGRADFGEVVITKEIDNATCDLNIYCASGKHIPKIEIEVCQASGDKHTYYKYVLEDVVVASSAVTGGSSDENRPLQECSLNFGKITWEYTPISHAGEPGSAITRIWNLETNKQE
jgi:type VI secretion system secreted protein Hcp